MLYTRFITVCRKCFKPPELEHLFAGCIIAPEDVISLLLINKHTALLPFITKYSITERVSKLNVYYLLVLSFVKTVSSYRSIQLYRVIF